MNNTENISTLHSNNHEAKLSLAYGCAATLLGCVLWGFSGTTVQYLITQANMTASMTTVLRMLIGGALFLVIIFITKRQSLLSMLTNRCSLLKMLLFSIGLYGNQICYSMTVQTSNAGIATIFETSGAAFVMLYVCARSHKAPKPTELVGLFLAILAATLIATQGNLGTLSMSPAAFLWACATGITAAVYIVIPKDLGLFDEFGAVTVTGVGMLFGCIWATIGFFVEGSTLPILADVLSNMTNIDWLLFFFGGILAGTMGGYGFYLKGVSMVGPVSGSLLSAAEPVSAMIFTTVWLGTVFTGWDIAGLIIMCVMIVFVTR